METKTTIENNELQGKESWNKPQINVIGINEDTLGNTLTGGDASGNAGASLT